MIIEEKTVKLKNDKEVILRSPMPSDAEDILSQMIQTSTETYFMTRYPEEVTRTVESEAKFLQDLCGSGDNFMVVATDNGRIVASAGLQRFGEQLKYRHRAVFGISIQKDYWHMGLGTCLMNEIISNARKTAFTQIELGVFEDNERAIRLYKKMGFTPWGIQPRAFRLKDGTYRDEIQMIYYL